LDEITDPCIYWSEFATQKIARDQEFKAIDFKLRHQNRRHVPAVNMNKDSSRIYLGIRQGGKRKYDGFTHIAGRILIHLGYYDKGSTQGLQLVYWCEEVVTLNVLKLDPKASKYLNILEKFYANKYKPLLGRH